MLEFEYSWERPVFGEVFENRSSASKSKAGGELEDQGKTRRKRKYFTLMFEYVRITSLVSGF